MAVQTRDCQFLGWNKASGTSQSSNRTGTYVPVVDDLIVVVFGFDNISGTSPSVNQMTVSGVGGVGTVAFTNIDASPTGGNAAAKIGLATARVTSDFGSGAGLTLTLSAAVDCKVIVGTAISGVHTTYAYRSGTAASGATSINTSNVYGITSSNGRMLLVGMVSEEENETLALTVTQGTAAIGTIATSTTGGGGASNVAAAMRVAYWGSTYPIISGTPSDGAFVWLTLDTSSTPDATLTTLVGTASASGGTGSMYNPNATLTILVGTANASGGTGSMSGANILSTLVGTASAVGNTTTPTLKSNVTVTTEVGTASAVGNVGSMTGNSVGTFSTATGIANASGGLGSMSGVNNVTFNTIGSTASASGGTGSMSGVQNGTLTTVVGTAQAEGNITTMYSPVVVGNYTFRVLVGSTQYELPDVVNASLGYEFSDTGALKIEYKKGGINYDRLGDNAVVIALYNGTEQFNSRWKILAGETDDTPESQTETFIGMSLFDVFRRTVVVPTSPATTVAFVTATAGGILDNLFDTAQARSAMTNITWDFTSSVDSNGVAWDKSLSITYKAGVTYLDLIHNLVDQGMMEARFNGNEFEVFKADTMGATTTVELRAGMDYMELPRKWSSENRAKFSMAVGDEGVIVTKTDTGIPTGPYGIEEQAISQGGMTDTGSLTLVNDAAIAKYAETRQQLTRKVQINEGRPIPSVNYKVGDYIRERVVTGYVGTAPKTESAEYRVRSIVVEIDQSGAVGTASITLNDKFLEEQIRTARKVAGIIGGASADGSGNGMPIDENPDTTVPNAPTGLTLDSTAYIDTNGYPKTALAVDWAAPTLNTDNSALTDLLNYEVQFKKSTDSLWNSIYVSTDYANIGDLLPGATEDVRVRAWDTWGHPSAFTATQQEVLVNDTTPPGTPSTPVVNSRLGQLSVYWDGLNNVSGAMPSDFSHTVVHASLSSGFTPNASTEIGRMLGESTVLIPNLTYGETWYVKLIAYDRAGNASSASAQGSGSTTQLVSGDMTSQIVSDIAAGVSAYTAVNVLLSGSPIYTKDTTNGSGKWIRVRYNVATTVNTIPTLEMINGREVLDKVLRTDALTLSGSGLGENYVGQLRTLVQKNASGAVTFTMTHDDGAAVYLDGTLKYSAATNGSGTVDLGTVTAGLHLLDILWAEQTGGDFVEITTATVGSKFDDLDAPISADVNPLLTIQANTVAQQAITAANGKNKLVHSTNDPSGSGFIAGDTWWKYDGSNIVIGQWRYTGSAWQSETIGNQTIANLDAAKITTGYLDVANRVAAGAIATKLLAVGDTSNYIEVNETNAGVVTQLAGTHIVTNGWSTRSDHSGASFKLSNRNGPVPFKSGARLRMRLRAKVSSGTATVIPRIFFFDADSNYWWNDFYTLNLTTTDTLFDVQTNYTHNSDTHLTYYVELADAANDPVMIKDARMMEMNAGQLVVDGSIIANKLAVNSVSADNLRVGSVTAEKLAALLILVGKIASAASGRRWEADTYGIRLYETDGTVLINLPTDPNSPATFNGDVVASSLTVIDQFALRGLVNEISKGAVLSLAAKTTAPSTPPSVTVGWDAITLTMPTDILSGEHLHGWVRDGSYYYTQYLKTNSPKVHITRYAASDLSWDNTFDITTDGLYLSARGGCTVMSGVVYATGEALNEHDYWLVEGWTISTKTKAQAAWGTVDFTNTDRVPTIGDNGGGGQILIAYRDTGANAVKVRKYSTSGTLASTDTTNITRDDDLQSVSYGTYDFGGNRYVFAFSNRFNVSSSPHAHVYHLSGGTWVGDPNEEWPLPSRTRGFGYDATLSRWVRLTDTAYEKFSSIMWSSGETTTWWASNTWYDSNATGGTHETDQGPRTKFTMIKRAILTVTSPPIPPRPSPTTTDDAVAVGLYLGRGSTDPGRAQMERQAYLSDGVRSSALTSVTLPSVGGNATNAPPSSNNFPDVTPGQIQAADAGDFVVKGDGSGLWHGITADASSIRVTKTAKQEQPLLWVNGLSSSMTTLVSGTVTDVDWSTNEITTNEDSWTSSDGITWVCPRNGTYSISVKLSHTVGLDYTIGETMVCYIYVDTKDGTWSTLGHFWGGTSYLAWWTTMPFARMEASDTLKIQVRADHAGQALSETAGDCYLKVIRLGGE